MLGAVYGVDEVAVAQGTAYYQVYLAVEDGFERVLKVEEVGDVVEILRVVAVVVFEIYEQVNVALVVEPISQDRPKDGQRLDFVLAAQVNDALKIQLDDFHVAKIMILFEIENFSDEKP